ncbi:cytochrome P450 [Mycena olivaceomarginata]|nr:cytochrome P450 [Mycena olivaceomarginata]
MVTPAFGVTQIRPTEIFVEKAVQLRDIWSRKVALGEKDSKQVDILSGLRYMTLDVIEKAGFNYDFDALKEANGWPSELNEVFTELLHSSRACQYALARLAQSMIPVLRSLVCRHRGGCPGMRRPGIANQIVMESKANTKLKDLAAKRDLLSVLVKANMSLSLPESQHLTHAEVIAPLSITVWALHALLQHTTVQAKLCNELPSVSTDNPTMEELNCLPYLETVVREVMRFHAPVVFTWRMAMEDDIVPLSKPYIDKAGKSHNSLLPERWENLSDAASLVPDIWANLLTFFAGMTNCIGFWFSLVEHVSETLLSAAVPEGGIQLKMSGVPGILQTLMVLGEEEKGSALPLIVRRTSPSDLRPCENVY